MLKLHVHAHNDVNEGKHEVKPHLSLSAAEGNAANGWRVSLKRSTRRLLWGASALTRAAWPSLASSATASLAERRSSAGTSHRPSPCAANPA